MQSSTAVAPHQCNNQQHNIYNIYSQHIFFMEDVTDKEGGKVYSNWSTPTIVHGSGILGTLDDFLSVYRYSAT